MSTARFPVPRVSRRTFLRRTGLWTGGTLAASAFGVPAMASERELPRRTLGRTGESVTVFTLGTAPCGHSRHFSARQIADCVDEALECGVNSIDTAPAYFNAEEGVGLALGERRGDVFLATKFHADSIAEAEESLAHSLQALKTDYLDLLYLHDVGGYEAEETLAGEGVFTWLVKQRQAGKVRFIGITGHSQAGKFLPYLETGEVDAVLMTLNFADRYTYEFEELVLPLCREQNVGVVAMKVFGGIQGGFPAYPGPRRPALIAGEYLPGALRYTLGLPGVATASIGVYAPAEVRGTALMASRYEPLTTTEQERLARVGRDLAAVWGEHFGPPA